MSESEQDNLKTVNALLRHQVESLQTQLIEAKDKHNKLKKFLLELKRNIEAAVPHV